MRFDLLQLRVGLEAALSSAITDELAILRDSVPLDVRGELVALATHAAAVLNGQGVASEIAACDSLRDLPAALPEALRVTAAAIDRAQKKKKSEKWRACRPDEQPAQNDDRPRRRRLHGTRNAA